MKKHKNCLWEVSEITAMKNAPAGPPSSKTIIGYDKLSLITICIMIGWKSLLWSFTICCDQFIIIQSRYFMVTRLIITDWDISADSDPTWSSWASATICYSGLTDWRMWQLHEVACLSSTIIMIRADKLIIVDTRTSPSITSLIELRSGTSRAR